VHWISGRAHDQTAFLNANETGPHTPGVSVELARWLGDEAHLPPTGAVLIAAPLPIVRGSGSPARVLALVPR
jgi:kynurenine formamidase